MAILQAFFAIVAYKNLEYRQFDIKNAFTESKLSKEFQMKIPKRIKTNKSKTIMHFIYNLYRLKQSTRD